MLAVLVDRRQVPALCTDDHYNGTAVELIAEPDSSWYRSSSPCSNYCNFPLQGEAGPPGVPGEAVGFLTCKYICNSALSLLCPGLCKESRTMEECVPVVTSCRVCPEKTGCSGARATKERLVSLE